MVNDHNCRTSVDNAIDNREDHINNSTSMARLYSVNDDHRCDHQATDNQAARFMAVEVADRLSTDDNDRTIY